MSSALQRLKDQYKSHDRSQPPRTSHTPPDTSSPQRVSPLMESITSFWNEHFKDGLRLGSDSFTGIGLLFIIIDELPHEIIWRTWIENASKESSDKVHIWIHAKHPERVLSPWVRERLVDFCLCPEWGSVELSKVMVRLAQTALSCPTVSTMCFVSETCLPIRSLEETLRAVSDDSKSWINWKAKPNNGYSLQLQFKPLYQCFPYTSVLKADQWVLLSRIHAEWLVGLLENIGEERLFKPFMRVRASDEMVVPTFLGALRAISDSETDTEGLQESYVSRRRVTYCNWTLDDAKSPLTFSTLDAEVLNVAVKEGCLFLRKVRGKLDWEERKDMLRRWCELTEVGGDNDKEDTITALLQRAEEMRLVRTSDDELIMRGERRHGYSERRHRRSRSREKDYRRSYRDGSRDYRYDRTDRYR